MEKIRVFLHLPWGVANPFQAHNAWLPVAIPALAWLPWYREIGPLSDLLSSPPTGSTPVEARPCVASSWGQL